MRSIRRLLVIASESQFGERVIAGIHAYCSQHGNWEYHLEPDQSKTMANRARFAVRQWKANGVIAQIRNASVERLVRSFDLPIVNFSGVFDLDLPTVTVDNKRRGPDGGSLLPQQRLQELRLLRRRRRGDDAAAVAGELREIRRLDRDGAGAGGQVAQDEVVVDRCEGVGGVENDGVA